jgi:hypothetical protein
LARTVGDMRKQWEPQGDMTMMRAVTKTAGWVASGSLSDDQQGVLDVDLTGVHAGACDIAALGIVTPAGDQSRCANCSAGKHMSGAEVSDGLSPITGTLIRSCNTSQVARHDNARPERLHWR